MSAALQQPVPARPMVFPSPVGGWNALDSYDAMPATDAIILDNIFPETSYARLRHGSQIFCATGQTAPVQTLMEWTGGANSKLLAATGGTIQDVTTGTAAALGTGFHSDVWSFTNFETLAGQFIIAANASGLDTPQVYNGATLVPAAITGVPPATLSQALVYGSRVFYVQNNTLSVWYAPAGDFQGALTQFDFGQLCRRGGAIASISSWTRDDASGSPNELFVMVTTKGEALIYSGVNPSDATTWQMVGRFLLGEPVSGPRCIMRLGADMILICEDGVQPLANYLQSGQSKTQAIALSRKIGNAVTAAVRSGKALAGWQGLLYPQGNAIYINVPQGNGVFYQFVINTITGSWCRYLNWNAWCWSLFNARPYFGDGAGNVWQADVGPSDAGADIVGEYLSAFQYAGGARSLIKRFTTAKPNLIVNGSLSYYLGIETDFAVLNEQETLSSNLTGPGLIWGTSLWGAAVWGSSLPATPQRRWSTVSGLGYSAAVHFKVSTGTIMVQLNGTDVLYEQGGFI